MNSARTQTLETCPVCGESALDAWRLATPASVSTGAEPSYPLLRCSRCGSATLADAQTEPARLYESGVYGPSRGSLDRSLEWLRRWVDRDRLRMLGGVGPGERVLEIGAGRGRLTAAMTREGAEVAAIDPSRTSSMAARARGVQVENVSLERADFEPGTRDLVVVWHVLEHLERPAEAMLRIQSLLVDGGRVVISVPNLDSLQARLGGDRWFHQDVPRHRVQFTWLGLDRLLRRSGFTPARRRHALIDQGLIGMWMTLLNRLTAARDVPFRFLKRDLRYSSRRGAMRDAFVVVLAGGPLLLLALVLEAAAIGLKRGGNLVVEARTD